MTRAGWLAYLRPHPGERTPTSLRLVIAAVSGAALSLSYVGYYLSIYSWICVGVLLVSIFGARARVAFGCGFLHGIFFCLTSLSWIATVLAVHGGVSRLSGWGLLLLIAGAWGILTGAFAWIVQRLATVHGIKIACIGAPFAWVALEFIRAHLPEIGFPWNLLGYPAAANLGFVQLTTVTGIYGLSFVVAAFNALLAWSDAAPAARPRRKLGALAAAAACIIVAMLIGPRLVPRPQANHSARAVQLNFPEEPAYGSNWFATHASQLQEATSVSLAPSAHQPDLLVWPEAPAPFSYQDPQFAKFAGNLASQFGHPFLAGAIEWKTAADGAESPHNALVPYNSALLFGANGQRIFTYDKIHLVPFGEYEPFPLIHGVVSSVSGEVGGFRKGHAYSVGPLPGGTSLGVFICYEAIFPNEVRRFVADGANLLVNISNDGWFGRSAAPQQHLLMARVRAVENRRWLVRVTNNGYTASVDPYGRIFEPIPADVRAGADLPYDFRTERTIYTRFGDWFAWLCLIVSAILLASTYWKGNVAPDSIPIPVDFLASPISAVPDPVSSRSSS
jgi:apolipoprotein N-acyltransferase